MNTAFNTFFNFTPFQLSRIEEIKKLPGFDKIVSPVTATDELEAIRVENYWVHHSTKGHQFTPRKPGPFTVVYSVNGKLYADSIGQKIIRCSTFTPN